MADETLPLQLADHPSSTQKSSSPASSPFAGQLRSRAKWQEQRSLDMTLIFAQARLCMAQPPPAPPAEGTLWGRSDSRTSEKPVEEDGLEELLELLESSSRLRLLLSAGAAGIGALLIISPRRLLEALLLLLESSESLEAPPPPKAPAGDGSATGDGSGVVEGGGLAVEGGAATGALGAALETAADAAAAAPERLGAKLRGAGAAASASLSCAPSMATFVGVSSCS